MKCIIYKSSNYTSKTPKNVLCINRLFLISGLEDLLLHHLNIRRIKLLTKIVSIIFTRIQLYHSNSTLQNGSLYINSKCNEAKKL